MSRKVFQVVGNHSDGLCVYQVSERKAKRIQKRYQKYTDFKEKHNYRGSEPLEFEEFTRKLNRLESKVKHPRMTECWDSPGKDYSNIPGQNKFYAFQIIKERPKGTTYARLK